MITFNDKVLVIVSFETTQNTFTWTVEELNPIDERQPYKYIDTPVEIFRGTGFSAITSGQIDKIFDITSIVNQRRWLMRDSYNTYSYRGYRRVNLINKYIVKVYTDRGEYTDGVTVVFYYKYPNLDNFTMNPYFSTYLDYTEFPNEYLLYAPLIQGVKKYTYGRLDTVTHYEIIRPKLLPAIPTSGGALYSLPIVGICNKNWNEYKIFIDCKGDFRYTQNTAYDYEKSLLVSINELCPAWMSSIKTQNIRLRGNITEKYLYMFKTLYLYGFEERWTGDEEYYKYAWVWHSRDDLTLTYRFRCEIIDSDTLLSKILWTTNMGPGDDFDDWFYFTLEDIDFIKSCAEPELLFTFLNSNSAGYSILQDLRWVNEHNMNYSGRELKYYLYIQYFGDFEFKVEYKHKDTGDPVLNNMEELKNNTLVLKTNYLEDGNIELNSTQGCQVETLETNRKWKITITDLPSYYFVYLVLKQTADPDPTNEKRILLGTLNTLAGDFYFDTADYKDQIIHFWNMKEPGLDYNYYIVFCSSEERPAVWAKFEFTNFIDLIVGDDYIIHGTYENYSEYQYSLYIIEIALKSYPIVAEVAEIKDCIKYYLMWQDRAGGFQCQPFEKTETYSEDFSRVQWETYNNAKRLASVEVQPQWKLNTGFIDDNLYPYYESIFVSPYIELWDIKNGTNRRVYVEDSKYTEKTFKNLGRKLFNLELTVKEDTKQHILY